MKVKVSYESERGCGYRKVGGTYLVCDGQGVHCPLLPIPLSRCPCCGEGISPQRSFRWVNPTKLIIPVLKERTCKTTKCQFAKDHGVVDCEPWKLNRAGLLWVGEKFYKTPTDFAHEARVMGISKRLAQIPKDFKVGETWVLLAHRWADPKQCSCSRAGNAKKDCKECKGRGWLPGHGIFMAYRPDRIERVITEEQAKDEDLLAKLDKRGITPVIVKKAKQQTKLDGTEDDE